METGQKLILHASRRYALIVFLGCMVFVVAGIWMLAAGEDAVVGLGCIVFFGGGSLLFVCAALDPRPRIVIDEGGVLDRSLAVGQIPWSLIAEARLESVYGVDLLCLRLHAPETVLARASRGRRLLHTANRAAGYGDVCISLAGLPGSPQAVLRHIQSRLLTAGDS